MAVACIRLGSHIPFLKKHAVRFAELHKEKLETIDSQIALLHQQRKSTFYSALGLEYTARIVGCLEVWLILNVLTTDVSFVGCILIVAFSSLLANLLFFLPMQLGGREGGFVPGGSRFVFIRSIWGICRSDYAGAGDGLDCYRAGADEDRKSEIE